MLQSPHILLTFGEVRNPLRPPHETTLQCPRVVQACGVYCASRQSGAHFLKISSSKSAPNPSVFNTFDLDRCFAPQRRALFDISTSKSCPELRCFVHFDFEMCFAQQRRAIVHLSSGQMAPHLPLSRAYTFQPYGATNHWKNIWFATFLPFRAPASSSF